jgi:hypothetical protein
MFATSGQGLMHMVLGVLLLLMFGGGPPVVSIIVSICSKSSISQVILAGTSLLYGVWFAYIVYETFYVHPDPQSGIILVFVGICALPVLLPLWLIAVVVDIVMRCRKKQAAPPPLS